MKVNVISLPSIFQVLYVLCFTRPRYQVSVYSLAVSQKYQQTSKKYTRIYMLYAELGRVPIEMHVKSQMIGYWISIINGCETKYCKKINNLMKIEAEKGKAFKWLNYIKQILISPTFH